MPAFFLLLASWCHCGEVRGSNPCLLEIASLHSQRQNRNVRVSFSDVVCIALKATKDRNVEREL
jgi:hypothetical protein